MSCHCVYVEYTKPSMQETYVTLVYKNAFDFYHKVANYTKLGIPLS